MKVHTMQQGTAEWLLARRGIPTASCFDRIVTPKTLKPSTASQKYLCELLAERFLAPDPMELQAAAAGFVARGSALEDEARRYYAMLRDVDVAQVGFVTDDAGHIGASPDGLIGEDGGLEIKAPSAVVHIANLLDPDNGIAADYRLQVQGNLWITGRDWWDLLSYHPTLPEVCVRVRPDEEVALALRVHVRAFAERLHEAHERMLKLGCRPHEAVAETEGLSQEVIDKVSAVFLAAHEAAAGRGGLE